MIAALRMSLDIVAPAASFDRPSVAAPPRVRSRFHVWLGLWMVAIVLVGFGRTYFVPLLRGTLAKPTVVHVHALVFLGWMTLMMAQVIVASRGNIRLHRRIGRWGIAYGCAVIVMGLTVGLASAVIKVNAGTWTRDQAAGSLLVNFGDMVSFAAWFGAAIWYRAQPEVHKRLMVVATVVLLFAALARWTFVGSGLARAGIWLSPIFIAMVHDWITRRRVHPVYILGSIALFFFTFRLLVTGSETWLRIGRPILDAVR
jgi:hypothetical protein